MQGGFDISFNLLEWLVMTGFSLSVLTIVYMVARVRRLAELALPLTYFIFLALGFAAQFAMRLEDFQFELRILLWLCWAMGPPLCALLVLQIARVHARRRVYVGAAFFVPVIFTAAFLIVRTGWAENFFETLFWITAMAGALPLLALWSQRNVLEGLWLEKGSKARYWLVLTLIAANTGGVVVHFLRASQYLSMFDADALMAVLGMAFTYLASTVLFRVYPQTVTLTRSSAESALTSAEESLVEKIKHLMEIEKLYHEQSFGRSDMARELGCSESTVSKVVSAAFGKSLPRLINAHRVADAQRMLSDVAIPVNVVASEVGFRSLAAFNRAFRDETGMSPTEFRAKKQS